MIFQGIRISIAKDTLYFCDFSGVGIRTPSGTPSGSAQETTLSPDALAVFRPTGVYLLYSFCSGIQFYLLSSPYLYFISFLYIELYALGDDALIH